MDSNDIIYSYSNENSAIQYAGYPINKYVENELKRADMVMMLENRGSKV